MHGQNYVKTEEEKVHDFVVDIYEELASKIHDREYEKTENEKVHDFVMDIYDELSSKVHDQKYEKTDNEKVHDFCLDIYDELADKVECLPDKNFYVEKQSSSLSRQPDFKDSPEILRTNLDEQIYESNYSLMQDVQ